MASCRACNASQDDSAASFESQIDRLRRLERTVKDVETVARNASRVTRRSIGGWIRGGTAARTVGVGSATAVVVVGRKHRFVAAASGGVESSFRPQIRRDYPLNLSILISGGKETKKDSLSNGE